MIVESPADVAVFDSRVGHCGQTRADDETFFCSPSCAAVGRHVLIFPDPLETYDEAVARALRAHPDERVVVSPRKEG